MVSSQARRDHVALAMERAHSQRQVLTRLISTHGAPTFLRSDNGPEFVSSAILGWLAEARIDTADRSR